MPDIDNFAKNILDELNRQTAESSEAAIRRCMNPVLYYGYIGFLSLYNECEERLPFDEATVAADERLQALDTNIWVAFNAIHSLTETRRHILHGILLTSASNAEVAFYERVMVETTSVSVVQEATNHMNLSLQQRGLPLQVARRITTLGALTPNPLLSSEMNEP